MKHLVITFITMTAGIAMMAQTNPVLPEGMEILTPEGVTLTTGDTRSFDMAKNIVVAGSKDKGYKTYFTAEDAENGEELWVTDGTASGTKMVKDIYPGPVSSNVSYITRFNDKVVFQATANEDDGAELWISDGTEDGTYMIVDLNILGGSRPQGFIQLNEEQFIFSAIDVESALYGDSEQFWLYVSDGTEEGTKMIKDCDVKYPGTNTNQDRTHFVRMGRKVFFKADTKDGEYGETLWITDGTPEGTIMLLDINTMVVNDATGATASGRIDWLTNFYDKKVFFTAYTAEAGQEPWVSDGTPEGTYMILDMKEGFETNGLPRGAGGFSPIPMGDYMYFRGYGPAVGMELFRTDFTAEGTTLVYDMNKVPIASGTNDGNPDLFCIYDGVLFMKGASGVNAAYDFCKGTELYYSDGTEEGTKMQSDLNPGTGSCAAWEGIVVSGSMYFRAQDETPVAGASQFWELFRIDNKDEFPKKVVDLGPGADFVHTLRNMNGDLYFTSKINPRLFKYSYRKPDYDPVEDLDEMDPVFDATGAGVNPIDGTVERARIEIVYNGSYLQFVTDAEILNASVYDVAGRQVINRNTGENSLWIKQAGIGNGVYIVKVVTSEGAAAKRFAVK